MQWWVTLKTTVLLSFVEGSKPLRTPVFWSIKQNFEETAGRPEAYDAKMHLDYATENWSTNMDQFNLHK